MIPVFKKLDENKNYEKKEIIAHINALQEEIFSCLSEITSANVTELSSDSTKISSDNGSLFSGDKLKLCGKGEEVFSAGFDKTSKTFEFSLKNKNGDLVFYFDGEKLIVAE